MLPEVPELCPFPSYDEQGGAGTHRVPPLAGAHVGLAQAKVGESGVQASPDDTLAPQPYFIHAVRDLRIAGIAKIVHHEHANPGQRPDRFSGPFLRKMWG